MPQPMPNQNTEAMPCSLPCSLPCCVSNAIVQIMSHTPSHNTRDREPYFSSASLPLVKSVAAEDAAQNASSDTISNGIHLLVTHTAGDASIIPACCHRLASSLARSLRSHEAAVLSVYGADQSERFQAAHHLPE